ncbi:MAG: hypothetical protein LHW58_04675, partial [Candidatus Cloacimonetes bacterium]|nr:hypothetical protein [Candidatus Cloacimonadota bacterium]MCK9178957.1 hypothetical protein [Candidatus Cloacimonadota bacterium]
EAQRAAGLQASRLQWVRPVLFLRPPALLDAGRIQSSKHPIQQASNPTKHKESSFPICQIRF